MKYKYEKCLDKLSTYRVGDVVNRGGVTSTWYTVISVLISNGYMTACKRGEAVVLKPIPTDVTMGSMLRQRMSEEEVSRIAYNFWKENYTEEYETSIPAIYMVMLFVDKAKIGDQIEVKDISTKIDKAMIYHCLSEMYRVGILDKIDCAYIKSREIPDNMYSFKDLRSMPTINERPPRAADRKSKKIKKAKKPKRIVFKKERSKLYKLAEKAGLYKNKHMDEITVIRKEEYIYEVKQGDNSSGDLGFEEALGLLASLMMPKNPNLLNWFKKQSI